MIQKTIWLSSMATFESGRWIRPNSLLKWIIRPERSTWITLPEEGKLQVRYPALPWSPLTKSSSMTNWNEWMIHSTLALSVKSLVFSLNRNIHIMRLNETEEEFDAVPKICWNWERQEAGLINAQSRGGRDERKQPLTSLSFHFFMDCAFVLAPVAMIIWNSFFILKGGFTCRKPDLFCSQGWPIKMSFNSIFTRIGFLVTLTIRCINGIFLTQSSSTSNSAYALISTNLVNLAERGYQHRTLRSGWYQPNS